jgi:glycosyltransferase involved in cell wall biosynthesis
VIGVSRWVAEEARHAYPLAGLRRRPVEVIYNGIDTKLFAARPWNERVPGRIVFAGTLKPQKGILPLLMAFGEVYRLHPRASLVLVGRDTLANGKSYYERVLEESGLDQSARSKIGYLGPVRREDLPRVFGSASVCVFPSIAESFGMVAVEAMAVARPVVYSRTSVGCEIIEDGVTGLLADPSDPSSLASAIARILCDEDLANSLARKAVEAVQKRFTIECCAESTLKVYRNHLRARH